LKGYTVMIDSRSFLQSGRPRLVPIPDPQVPIRVGGMDFVGSFNCKHYRLDGHIASFRDFLNVLRNRRGLRLYPVLWIDGCAVLLLDFRPMITGDPNCISFEVSYHWDGKGQQSGTLVLYHDLATTSHREVVRRLFDVPFVGY